MNRKTLLPVVVVVLVALGFNLDRFTGNLEGQPAPAPAATEARSPSGAGESRLPSAPGPPRWSSTAPRVNLTHIFEGEINHRGKPVGFHARPGGVDPANARVVRIRSRPNRAGVYTATVSIRDASGWKEKFSSFFPDRLSPDEVVAAVLSAYRDSSDPRRQPWSGASGRGFEIQGYTAGRGEINTAFPIYRRD